MKYTLQQLSQQPNALADHYQKFNVAGRLLLTGHSHQAWPDVAFDGMEEAWHDAATLVDDKWGPAFEKAEAVRKGFATILDDTDGLIALAPNTHELVLRFLSALPLKQKPKIVTTDGEFHTVRRQLVRLEEEGIGVVRVTTDPLQQIVGKIIDAIDEKTSAVIVSAVFYETGLILPDLDALAEACNRKGVYLLVDAYHALNAIPFTVRGLNLQQAFIVGGGYKYCQLGEGNCFMRFPADCTLRPVITGWFSEFSMLADKNTGKTAYGQGHDLFAGSTYDPISHYRAAAVFQFFRKHGLSPEFLRKVSQHQTSLLAKTFLEADIPEHIISMDTGIKHEQRAGFLVLKTNHADWFCKQLHQEGVLTDYRGTSLRFGPAPYLSDNQLTYSMRILADIADYFPGK